MDCDLVEGNPLIDNRIGVAGQVHVGDHIRIRNGVIVAFLDGSDFEDSIRNAISIGGDSDTIGCITGSIAEAFYGIPQDIREKGFAYLPKGFQAIVTTFEEKYGTK